MIIMFFRQVLSLYFFLPNDVNSLKCEVVYIYLYYFCTIPYTECVHNNYYSLTIDNKYTCIYYLWSNQPVKVRATW